MTIGASKRFLRILAAVALSVGVAGNSNMASADALIVAARGDIEPPVEAFSEAAVGDRFLLGQTGEIIILHYAACVEAHFRGGAVTVRPDGFQHAGSRIGETRVECPQKIAFAEETNAVAAVVLRGDASAIAINVRPVFVALADGVTHVEISQDGAFVRRLAMNGGRLTRWPVDAPPLAAGQSYNLSIVSVDGARTTPVVTAAIAGVTVIDP